MCEKKDHVLNQYFLLVYKSNNKILTQVVTQRCNADTEAITVVQQIRTNLQQLYTILIRNMIDTKQHKLDSRY